MYREKPALSDRAIKLFQRHLFDLWRTFFSKGDFGSFDDQLKSANSLAHFECDPGHLLT
jgi:hypothetical protein